MVERQCAILLESNPDIGKRGQYTCGANHRRAQHAAQLRLQRTHRAVALQDCPLLGCGIVGRRILQHRRQIVIGFHKTADRVADRSSVARDRQSGRRTGNFIQRQRDPLNHVGNGVGSLAHRYAVHLEIGILRGDGLCQILCAGRIMCQQAAQRGIAAHRDFHAVAHAIAVRGQREAIRCAATIVDDGGRHARLGGIDRIANALQRIVAAVYGDARSASAV